MLVRDTLFLMERSGLVDPAEAAMATAADERGDEGHTIGYELEVLARSAAIKLPKVREAVEGGVEPHEAVAEELETYAYGVVKDGEYELQSPPAAHPLPLATATRGLVTSGWLPVTAAEGAISTHISIGTDNPRLHFRNMGLHSRIVNLLRSVDLAGGASPERLIAPAAEAEAADDNFTDDYSWNQRGLLGVSLIGASANPDSDWHGENRRIEFRSGEYRSPEQFQALLERLYFLTRGLLGEERAGRAAYERFEQWFRDYQVEHGLPYLVEVVPPYDTPLKIDSYNRTEDMRGYMEPYAEHLATQDMSEVTERVALAAAEVAEAYGLADTLQDDDVLIVA